MKKVIVMGGSSSKKSINKSLANYAGEQLKEATPVQIDLSKHDLPLYSIDKEIENGIPQEVMDLNELVAEADGFILSLAEHNGAYTAAFKNAFDWLSRVEAKVWRKKPMLLMSTSPGGRGGMSALELGKSRFPFAGAEITGTFSLPSFNEHFKEGHLVNDEYAAALGQLVVEFEAKL